MGQNNNNTVSVLILVVIVIVSMTVMLFQMLSEKEREIASETPMLMTLDNADSRFISAVGYH